MNRLNRPSRFVLLLFIAAVFGMTGCSFMAKPVLKMGVNLTAPYMPEAVHGAMAGVNTCYGQGQYGVPGMLVMLAMMSEISPANYTVNWTASQAFVATAAFNEMHNTDYASDLAWQGYRVGMRSLKAHRGFRKAVENGMPPEKAVSLLPKKYIEGMTWTAMSLCLWLTMNIDDAMAITYAPLTNNLLKRAVELDPAYFDGLPLAIDAAFSAVASEMVLGCGVERARESYETLQNISGGKLLIGEAFYAQYYAVQMRDRELFQKILQKIIAAPDDILEYRGFYMTTLAKGRAKWLLENEETVFENLGTVR